MSKSFTCVGYRNHLFLVGFGILTRGRASFAESEARPRGQKVYRFFITALCLFLFGGCASTTVVPVSPPPTENQQLIEKLTNAGLNARETHRGVAMYSPKSFFEFDKSSISKEAEAVILFVASIVKSELTTDRKIAIEGHADSWGSDEYNIELSKKRSLSVKQLLIDNGVEESRMSVAWFGESRPLLPEKMADGSDNPEARAGNRRVEIILLNPDQN